MTKKHQHWVSCLLITGCAFVLSVDQFTGLDEVLGGTNETCNCHPFDQCPLQTQWKRELPLLKTSVSSKTVGTFLFITQYQQNEIITLPDTYTLIVTPLPHPPFKPRDSSPT
jgi:hypothetical protein